MQAHARHAGESGICCARCRFDALGLVHKLDIDGAGGKVTYLSHKLNRGTEAYIGEHGVMPPNGGTFAEPPATGLVGRALAGVTGASRGASRTSSGSGHEYRTCMFFDRSSRCSAQLDCDGVPCQPHPC